MGHQQLLTEFAKHREAIGAEATEREAKAKKLAAQRIAEERKRSAR
jgi:hypothetical protein